MAIAKLLALHEQAKRKNKQKKLKAIAKLLALNANATKAIANPFTLHANAKKEKQFQRFLYYKHTQ